MCVACKTSSGEGEVDSLPVAGRVLGLWWGAHAAASNRLCKAARRLLIRELIDNAVRKQCRMDVAKVSLKL